MRPDRLGLEDYSPLGGHPVVMLDLADPASALLAQALVPSQAIVVGHDAQGLLPVVAAADFDILLTSRADAPAPWVAASPDEVEAAVRAHPIAACTLGQVLRLGEAMTFDQALTLESLAYSALLGGSEFATWRAAHPPRNRPLGPGPFMVTERSGDALSLTLNRPEARNAVCAAVRDALFEALAAALDDPTQPTVTLTGAGPSFSAGGDLDEFGSAKDLGLAHVVRVARYPAGLVHALGERMTVTTHGACIGAGVEIAAAAYRRLARPDAIFQLPEVGMGLIPGAGGTVSVPRAVGRHRAAWMAVTGAKLDARTALDWGLIHAIIPA